MRYDSIVLDSIDAAIPVIKNRVGKSKMFIGITGGSGSGKTYFSQKLETELGAGIFEMDDYYHNYNYVKRNLGGNWDTPAAIDMPLLESHLTFLRANETVQKPVYSMSLSKRTHYEEFKPEGPVIVEGLYALRLNLSEFLDLKIFIDVSEETMLKRRLERDEREGRTANAEDRRAYFEGVVLPMYETYILPCKERADIVVKNE